MSKKRRIKKMNLIIPKNGYSSTVANWRRLKQIAENSMERNNYNIYDVKKDLENIRSNIKETDNGTSRS